MNNLIAITKPALNELKHIADIEEQPLRVRIIFNGGGCNGYTIDMNFTKWPKDEEFDISFIQDDIEFLVDKKSAVLLKDATLDFGGGLLTKGFIWEFPSSTGSCGCGLSFSF